MSDTSMEGVDSATQGEQQQPDANNGDQTQPPTEADENQQPGPVSRDDQIGPNTAEYEANLQNRQRHDHEWWGAKHSYPRPGHPDREFMFSRNPPISRQEFGDVVAAYDNVATNQGTEPFNTLGVSMRPTTPPMERAKKQVDGLVEQGFEVTWALRDEIYEKFTRDSGLIAALQEYCRDGQSVPPAQANELLKMVDRLKALMSKEMSKYSEQLGGLSDDFDDYKKLTEERVEMLKGKNSDTESKLTEAKDRLESKQRELDKIQQQGGVDPNDDSAKQINKLKEENFVLSEKLKRSEEEVARGKEDLDQLQGCFDKKANGLYQSEEKVSRLLKEKAALQSKIVMYEAGKSREEVEGATGGEKDLKLLGYFANFRLTSALDDFDVTLEHEADLRAAEERAERANQEREQGDRFHQHFYEAMKEKVSAWKARAAAADESSQGHGSSVSDDTVKLLREVTKDWDDAVNEFQRSWPPAFDAFHGGQVEADNVLRDLLEKSKKELRECKLTTRNETFLNPLLTWISAYEEKKRQMASIVDQEGQLTEEFYKMSEMARQNEKRAGAIQESIEKLEKLTEEHNRLSAEAESSRTGSSRPSNSNPESPRDPSTPGNNKSSSAASSPPEDIRALKEKLSSYQDIAAENDDEIRDLNDANEKLAGQVKDLRGKNEELERQHQENQEEIKKLEARRKSLFDDHMGLIEEQNGLRADLKKIRGEKQELEKLQEETVKRLQDIETVKAQLESERAVDQTQLKKLQDEKDSLEKLQQDDAKRLRDLEERVEADQKSSGVDVTQLDDLRKEKAQLESQHAADQDDLGKARADNTDLTRERDELQKSLERKTQEAKGLQQENRQMQVDHKEQTRQLERNMDALQRSHSSNQEELRWQGFPNHRSADALIRAAGALGRHGGPIDDNDHTPTAEGGSPEMSLMDRINYLNLSVFLRTRNYVQLALREGCNRLANMLIHDANNWADQCAEDLSKMNPSVNSQVRASIYVLNGLKRVMVAKDMEEIGRGARELKYGQKLLVSQEDADPATFGQLVDLAASLAGWLDRLSISHDKPERLRGLQADKASWMKNVEFVVKRRAKKLHSEMRDDANLKVDALRRTGLHSPLTPEKWDQDVGLEEPRFGDDATP